MPAPCDGDARRQAPHYERLEFLGDRVLGLVVAAAADRALPRRREGALTHRQAALVRKREPGRGGASALGLGRWLAGRRSEVETAGGRGRHCLADGCEALIGAIYLDGGLGGGPGVRRAALAPHDSSAVQAARRAMPRRRCRSGRRRAAWSCRPMRSSRPQGPPHALIFTVEVRLAGPSPQRGERPPPSGRPSRPPPSLMLQQVDPGADG